MLGIEGLTRRFGDKLAVDNVSLSIHKGAFVGVIGRSGAGKSTLLRMINRLQRAERRPHPLRRHATSPRCGARRCAPGARAAP